MKTLTTQSAYGYQELRQVHQRYMMLAMLSAIIIQMMVIGGYRLSEWLKTSDEAQYPWIGPTINILPVPPLHPINEGGAIPIIAANLAKGIPVPVLDAVVDTSIKFASQEELAEEANNAFSDFSERLGNGTISIPPNGTEMLPKEIWQVETLPMAIVTPKPEYPILAVRACLEGSATVKVLLNREGKVEKSVLLKTSEGMFAQPALDAAQKWIFTPALMNGKPVQVWVSIPFRFRLTGR